MSSHVSIENVQIAFTPAKGGAAVLALDECRLELPPGRFVSIVGPSGCGKTTLLRAMAGLQSVSAGRVMIDGDEVNGPRRETSVMFQAPTLLPWLDVLGNVMLPAKIAGKVSPEKLAQARELLQRAGLGEFERKLPTQLSGGMQQRVALCRALSTDPSLLLLDEPFGALDAMTRDQMNLELHKLWVRQAPTTVLITHSINEAVLLSEQIVVMSARPGRVLEIVDVDLPRERDASLLSDPAFVRVAAHIRSYFTEEADHDAA